MTSKPKCSKLVPSGLPLVSNQKFGSCRVIKSALSILLLCFLLASCGEEKVVQGESKEVKEMRVRAEAGDAEAQSDLGEMYDRGKAIPHDMAEAAKWVRKAAEQGSENAKEESGE